MTRKLLLLSLAGSLLLPIAAESQALPDEPQLSAEAEATVFRSAINEIANRHREQYSLETLWEKTIDALLEPGQDSLATFTTDEIQAFNALKGQSASALGTLFGQRLEGEVLVR